MERTLRHPRHLFFIVSANICNFLFTYGISLIQGTVLLKQFPFTGCSVNPSFNASWSAVAICLTFETLSIVLIIYKSWRVARSTGIKTPLFTQLFNEGLGHYLLFVAAKLFVFGCVAAPTVISAVALPSFPHFLVIAVVVNRLFIRLRQTMLNQTPGLTNYTTNGVIVFNHGTGEDDGRKGITTIGGSDKAGRRIQAQRHSHLDDELFSLPVDGEGVEMSLSEKDGELQPSDSTWHHSTVLPISTTSGSSSNVDVSALDSKPCDAV